MNWDLLWKVGPQLAPMSGEIQHALATYQRLAADPDVKQMIATAQKVASIIAAAEKS